MSNRSNNDNTPRPQFSVLGMTPEMITKLYDHMIKEEERFQREKTRIHKNHEESRKRTSDQVERSEPLRKNFSAGQAGSTAWGGFTEGMLKSVGTGVGVKGTLVGGLSEATKGLGGLVKGFSASQVALNVFIQGVESAAKALMKYSKETNEHSNTMIQNHTVSRSITSEFMSQGQYAMREANQLFGVNVLNNEDVRKISEAILPLMKDLSPEVHQSFTETGLVGQALGVGYNEQVIRMFRQQYQSSGKLGDAQLDRLEALAKLSQEGNLSLDELVQLQADTQKTANQFAYQLYNSFSSSLGADGALTASNTLLESDAIWNAFLTSEYSLSQADAQAFTQIFHEFSSLPIIEAGDYLKKYINIDGGNATEMYERLLDSYASGNIEGATEEFLKFVDYTKSTTQPMWGATDIGINSALTMVPGFTDPRATDLITSGSFRAGDTSLSDDVRDIKKYLDTTRESDEEEEQSTVQSLMEDWYLKPSEHITGAINSSYIGIWAKYTAAGLGHAVSKGTGKLVKGTGEALSAVGKWVIGDNPIAEWIGELIPEDFNTNPYSSMPNLRLEAGAGGGVGGGIGGIATPGTAPEGVGDYTLSAGYMDPAYKAKFGRDHKGVDYAAPSGTPIISTTDGTVTHAGWNSGGFGNLVLVRDSSGNKHYYAHMVDGSMKVKAGQTVRRGQVLGGVGTTGLSTGNHLHYQVDNPGGAHINPRSWIPGLFGQAHGSYIDSNSMTTSDGLSMDGDSTPGNMLRYRQSLLGLVTYRDNSALYSSKNFGVGGMIANSMRDNRPQIDNTELVDALNVLIGAVSHISGNIDYGTRYNPKLGRR